MANEDMTMREKIARAILKARYYDIEPHMYDSLDAFHADTYPEHWDEALAEADAALDALAEPDDLMKVAGGLKCEEMMFGGDDDATGIIFNDMGVVFSTMVRAAKENR